MNNLNSNARKNNVSDDHSVSKRSPLSLPTMRRVDVRTLQLTDKKSEIHQGSDSLGYRTLSHSFKPSGCWDLILSSEHPILSGHQVYGQELLPGLAWVDFLYQWFAEAGYSYETLELKNLSIYRPLIISEKEQVALSVQAIESKEGFWTVQVSNASIAATESAPLALYMSAQMHPVSAVSFKESVNIDEVLGGNEPQVDFLQLYQKCQSRELLHTGVMKAKGVVSSKNGTTWMHVKVDEEVQVDTQDFLFHPALIDGSGVGAGTLLSKFVPEEQKLFLPLFIESFNASEMFGSECYVRIKEGSIEIKEELISLTMEFFNSEGNKIGELKNFKNKLVRHDGFSKKSQSKKVAAANEKEIELERKSSLGAGNLSFDSMTSLLQSIIAAKLDLDTEDVALELGYYELGLDSAMLLDVVKIIESALCESLSPTLLFEYTNIKALAEHLEENFDISELVESTKQPKAHVSINKKEHNSFVSGSMKEELVTNNDGKLQSSDIAVIGMSGRYPQSSNLSEFWENLKAAKDCITEVPSDRWDSSKFDNFVSPSGKKMSKWGGFIDDAYCFDPKFFRISPQEAEWMDPQERLFLEVCWEAIEDAGYTPKNIVTPQGKNNRRAVGVFAGVMHKDYALLQHEAIYEGHQIPLTLSYASIANRVSYFCDFHGPSLAIDTVCSSSLNAVHLAMESLIKGESKVALAGGVNLSLHPNKYQSYGMNDMHSSDGYCHTFGEGGDGYVSADGIGAVLLKPLQQAIADGDAVYAVLKGSSINHVGAVSGFTVPSPVAQGEMIAECLRKIGINPETISYIEAHGTGTSLGDPIEIQGLKRAFGEFTAKQQFCALGSVKSNMGHAEGAAGISGLTKTILQLHHKTLVKSLHSEVINPYLDLSSSPFYVQAETQEWKVANKTRRRAGISSFGATGSNAHVIIEEFCGKENLPQTQIKDGVLLPISAKNMERLREYVERLTHFLEDSPETDLLSLAFTMQTGRVAMEERLLLLVSSIEQAIEKLKDWLGNRNSQNIWCARVNLKAGNADLFEVDADLQEAIARWIAKGKLKKIAELWMQGFSVKWHDLYRDGGIQRIHLPTYPFAKESYQVCKPESQQVNRDRLAGNVSNYLHPLLHENTSDLVEQRFSSKFVGNELFLVSPQRRSQIIISEVSYLEMACAAVARASVKNGVSITLKNVEWGKPIVLGDETNEMHISLFEEDNDHIQFEVYTCPENIDDVTVHFNGTALLAKEDGLSSLDMSEIKSQMQRVSLKAEVCYQLFKQMGVEYGAEYQGIQEIYKGENQVLAKLSLPEFLDETRQAYLLHPCLLDSALQASIGLMLSEDFIQKGDETLPKLLRPSVPVALVSLEILAPCSSAMYAWIRYSDVYTSGGAQILDIDLTDDQGKLCVKMRGVSFKLLDSEVATIKPQNILKAANLNLYQEYWEQVPVTEAALDLRQVVYVGVHDLIQESLQERLIERTVTWNSTTSLTDAIQRIEKSPDQEDSMTIIYRPETGKKSDTIKDVFRLVQACNSRIGQLILIGNSDSAYEQSWVGFERSIGFALPKLRVTILYNAPSAMAIEQCMGRAGVFRYDGKAHQQLSVKQLEYETAGETPLKEKGTYLITGGMGALGQIFATYLAKNYHANLVLIGRSNQTAGHELILEKLLDAGASSVRYEAIAIDDADKLHSLASKLEESHCDLVGVIHAAGIEPQKKVTNVTWSEFDSVLSANIAGTDVINAAFKKCEWICYFTSSSAVLGDLGSCSYAVGKRYQMAVSQIEDQQVQPRYIAINWPLWQNGGMGVSDEAATEFYLKSSGQSLLTTAEGIDAFEVIIAKGYTQALVMNGDDSRISDFLTRKYRPEWEIAKVESNQAGGEEQYESGALWREVLAGMDVAQCVSFDIKGMVEQILKLPIELIEDDVNFADFGFDSIGLTKFSRALSTGFGIEITPSVFFSFTTLSQLCSHLLSIYSEHFTNLYLAPVLKVGKTRSSVPSVEVKELKQHAKRRVRKHGFSGTEQKEDIAIVGVSGQFPDSSTVEEFWEILSSGKTVVKEIPESRWGAVGNYYDETGRNPNKSYSKWAGMVAEVDAFDPLFFEISPREAEFMSPEERLFLMEAYHALEDGGINPAALGKEKVGVFVGMEEGEQQGLRLEKEGDVGTTGLALTSSGGAMISSRLSYFLNLRGPVVATNTACSSSLVAFHQACMSLQNKESDVALVGGIALLQSSSSYVMMSQGRMLSEDGKCHTFSKHANGIVGGESVAVLVLKRRSDAEAAKDHIYGLVKASGINFNGKTNGVTAPSGEAQAELIKDVYQQSNIDVEQLGYIVTHGTGTKLGDPVEVNALLDVFKGKTTKQQYCALTSNKPNLGHTLAASGLVNVINLLCAIEHQVIPASLNCAEENDYINWSESPFYVNKYIKNWQCDYGKKRVGAVSSFGRSGTNAHVVIEEYQNSNPIHVPEKEGVLVVSVKAESQLIPYLEAIYNYVNQNEKVSLADLLYTFQVGREAMKYRLAIVVQSRNQLLNDLKSAIDGRGSPVIFKGILDRKQGVKVNEGSAVALIRSAMANHDLVKLGELWANGANIHWQALYESDCVRRITGLPVYPFAKERYQISETQNPVPTTYSERSIHPLLHENTSDLSEQRFTSTFTGTEFFLRDHKVKGESVLPGVGYLEMARAAVEKAAGDLAPGTIITLNNVVWTQPIVVNGVAKAVHIGLSEADNEQLHYDIYTQPSLGEEIIHSQGEVAFLNNEAPSHLDLRDIRSQMTQGVLDAEICYRAFDAMGLCYGAGHRGIQEIYQGEEQVLAQLALPPAVLGTQQDYLLHPSLMDAALQSSIGLILHNTQQQEGEALQVTLPFALDSLAVIAACSQKMYAWVRRSDAASAEKAAKRVQKLDIDLCDEQGQVCVRMRGFSSRVLEKDVGVTYAKDDMQKTGTLFAKPVWQAAPVAETQPPQSYAEHHVMLCGLEAVQPDELSALIPAGQCRAMPIPAAAEVPYNAYAVSCFEQL
ncbi:beta-ketoacyl synthase N-terminal-like domain-containing protein, partial [Serratia proteamaculans]